MFDDTTLGTQILANPASVQRLVLQELESRLGGTYSVADPNNSFNLLLEATSSMNAQSVRSMEASFDAQYAVRATTSAELYNNMSDFDYLSMVAAPAGTTVNLTFNADYLITNALTFDANYKRVVIPANTQFYIGPLTFSLYYPINIDISQVTNNINVLWDTSVSNPLKTLSTNMVPAVQYSVSGLNLITLTIPISQFAIATQTYSVVAQQGFIQSISYANQFYAARVFTNLPTGSWTELAYTLSETVYDPTTPTAKLVIQNDTNTLKVSIPQIYFTNNQIGNQVKVVIYTTTGAVNLDLTSVEVSNCNLDFGLSSPDTSVYSSILANLATIILIPAEKTIVGGSNAIAFAALRNLVINGGLYSAVPVTPAELTAFAAKQGFSISKFIDNITNRIYYASNTITGGQNGYVMVTTATIGIQPTAAGISTILNFPNDNTVTVLPTTLYTFNAQNKSCTPLTDVATGVLNRMTKSQLATELNTNSYTKCPFHLVTYTGAQYPVTKSFNLMNPTASTIRFITDNVNLAPQMSVVSAVVIHKNQGTGGYTLRLGVVKTPSMAAIAESDITVYLGATDANGDHLYGIANLTGTSGVLSIYELQIPSTYYITQQGTFRSTMLVANQTGATTVDLNLATTFTVTFLVTAALYPNVAQDVSLVTGLSYPYANQLGVCRQEIDVVFGVDLSTHLFNSTNAVWSAITYQTYPSTIYQTYPTDVYATNTAGGLIYTVVGGQIQLTKLHSAGDTILDSNGHPVVLHAAGSVYLDGSGQPIALANRQLQYFTSSMMFDLRLFYSENALDVTFVQNITGQLTAYFDTLTTIQDNLLEQTSLFYQPNSTMGTALFSAGNNTPLTLDLGFGFALVVYVSQATLDSPNLTAAILSDILSIIQTEMTNSVISLTSIADAIRSQLTGIVLSVDVEGIDNTTTLQTVIVPSGTTSPIIGQKLVYSALTDSLALQSNVTVTFELAA